MDFSEDKRVTKTKFDKEASKAAKKQQKEERKVKSLAKTEESTQKKTEEVSVSSQNKEKSNKVTTKEVTTKQVTRINHKVDTKHAWFKHLFQAGEVTEHASVFQDCIIHPNFINLGLEFGNKDEYDATHRCELFLNATKQLVLDFTFKDNEDFSGRFISMFDKHIAFINHCRPLTVTTHAAVKYIKYHLMRMTETNNALCINFMIDVIDRFISERIEAAHNTIVSSVSKHIKNGYRILVYSFSQIVVKSLLFAWNQSCREYKDKFQVIVIDTFPCSDSKKMIQQLKLNSVPFCKAPLSSLPQIIKQINLVLLDAHSVLSNNNVMSRSGSASIANVAKLHGKPVIICAETFKFNTHGQFDILDNNELGNQDVFIDEIIKKKKVLDECKLVKNWRQNSLIIPVDLLYDIIPHKMITAICSEFGSISPTTNLKQPLDS